MARPTREELTNRLADDRKAAAATLATRGGEALVRALWAEFREHLQPGLGATSEATAYRVALRDVLEALRAIREEHLNG